MRILSKKPLREFWAKHPDAEQPLKAWWAEAKHATWHNPTEIKQRYPSARIIGERRIVFNIGGGTYRLVVKVNYAYGQVFVRFIGTHEEYDRIDVETV